MSTSDPKTVGRVNYTRSSTIYGNKDSINALSISGDGKHLVSGGDEGLLRVFSLEDGYTEICRFQNSSPALSIAWLNHYSFTFLMGDWSGDLFTIRVKLPDTPLRNIATTHWVDYYGGRVYCVTVHDVKCLVAVAHGSKVSISRRTTPRPSTAKPNVLPSPGIHPDLGLANAQFAHEIPFSMHFNPNGDVLMVTYYQHGTVGWDVDSRQKLWHIPPHTFYLGYSALSPDRTLMCRTNLFNGVDWISLARKQRDAECVAVTEHECHSNYIVPIVFTFKGEEIVIGGDRGCATVWSVKDSKPIETLQHGSPGDMVQALAYHRGRNKAVIVSATANMGADTTISIWTENRQSFPFGEWFPRWSQSSSYFSRNIVLTVIGAFSVAIIAVISTLLLTDQIVVVGVSGWSLFSYSPPNFRLGDWKAPFVRTLTETNYRTVTAFQPRASPSEPSTPALTATTPLFRRRNIPLPTVVAAGHTAEKTHHS